MFKHLKLRGRLLLSFFLITCISTVSMTVFSIYYFSDKIRSEALLNMRKHIQLADLIYQNQVKEIKNTSHRLSRQNALKLLVHFEIKPKLAGHLDQFLQNINAHQLIVVNPQKQRLAQAVKPDFEILNNFQDFTHNALLEVALKEDRSVASSEHIKLNGQSFLAISAISPIHRSDRVKARSNAPNKRSDNSAIIGAVIVHYILNNNAQLSERIQDLLGVDAVIYQNGQAINYKTLQHTLSPPHIKPALYQQLISTPGNLEVAEIDFDGQLAEYQSVKNISGQAIAVLAISRSAAPYMQTILKAGLSMLGIMLFCIIGASVLGYWLAHSILGPLNHLLNGVKRITSGDLSYEISLDLKDEMGTLATAFNGMSRQLHELVETLEQRIEQATHKLQNALAHLAAIIDNMPDGLLVTDNRTLIIQVNPALSAMFPNYNNPESGSESLLEKECTQFNAEISELIHQSRLYPNKVHSAEIKLAGEHIGQAVATAIIQKDSLHEEAGTYIGSQYIGSVVLIRDITREKEIDQMMKNTIDTLTRVGTALSAEKNLNTLLDLFVAEARNVCHADGGTLYVLKDKQLYFKIVQNQSMNIFMGGDSGHSNTLPAISIDENKISAHCAKHKEVIQAEDIYHDQQFDFSSTIQYDAEMGYKTHGMLAIPMLDRRNQAVGVLQLINPTDPKTGEAARFEKNQIEIIYSLASQAAVAVENIHSQEQIARKNAAFKRFVPTEFISHLGKKEIEEVKLGEATQESMSVLFSDIRAFTSLSEQLTPEETFNFLNIYLQSIGPNIVGNGGFIDKYIGDAIMALFPGKHPYTTDNAVVAAIGMIQSLQLLNQYRKTHEQFPIYIGIGIHTGPLTLGTIGFEERIESTVIGDTVNVASRVESLTKQYAINIGITESTYQCLNNPDDYLIREIDTVQVKGKAQSLTIYSILDAEPEARKVQFRATLDDYHQALSLYKQRQWQEAVDIFNHIDTLLPGDRMIEIYQERCHSLLEKPPLEGTWTGVTRLTKK